MTIDPQLLDLVRLLASGRRSPKLTWTHTSDPDVFRMVLEEGLIRIERIPGSRLEKSTPAPFYYGIEVFDKSGSQVLGGSDMYSKEDFAALANLYEQVFDHLHLEVVGRIMNELQSKLGKMPA